VSAPNLDVVVVTYRSGPLVRGCIDAAVAFAGSQVRIVLVDNSPEHNFPGLPTDGSWELKVIQNDRNVGYAAAVNQAIRVGDSALVLLLNPDITAIRGDVGTMWAEFAADDRLAAITPRLVTTEGVLEPTMRREPTPFDLVAENLDLAGRFPGWQRSKRFRMLDDVGDRRQVVDAATGACLFMRRAAIDDVGPFDESFFVYWEETDWLIRAKRRGWSTLYLPDVEAVHLGRRSTNVSSDVLSLLLLEGQYTYSRKHFGRLVATALRVALLTVDALRWALRLTPGAAVSRARLGRRIRVHVTGRAPRPEHRPARGQA
jgi:GT2 family glycosyltransferase